MALTQRSLLLYGFQVTEANRSIDFKKASLGPTLLATLNLGYYSLTGLCAEVTRALFAADPTNVYACSVNRNVSGGLENRVTIATSGSFLSLLFLTGPRTATTTATLLGFNIADYTGLTNYTGSSSAGTPLIPDYVGYNYLGPENQQKVFGAVNLSASGLKEAIVFQIQKFVDVEFKYEPQSKIASQWQTFFSWAIQQRPFEFTPEVTVYNTFYNVTLEKTTFDGKALGYQMKEMVPQFPSRYTTGPFTMRLIPT